MRFGTLRMPLDQTALFNFTSTRTSDVFIIFCANVLICVWLIQEVKGVLSQFLFRVFWGLAPEHNFPSSLSLGRVARRARTNAHHAQIRDKRANKYTACTLRAFRASLASRNRIHFSRFQVCFYAKIYASKGKTKGANLRVEEKCIFGNHAERARTAFTARGALFLKVTPCVALPKLMVYSLVTTSSAPILSLCVSRVVVLSKSGEISLCFLSEVFVLGCRV